MSSKSTQAVSKHSATSHLFSSGKGKSLSRSMTSDTIADDIAAFKKRGGRIEILGNTPSRARTQATTFRSSKPRPAASSNTAARG